MMNKVFNTKIKALIGVTALAFSVVIGSAMGFSDESNGIMSVTLIMGLLSLINIIVSKIFKTDVPYVPFMAGNCVGLAVSLFIVSMTESIGSLYMWMFLIVVFAAMWVYEMWILGVEGTLKRVMGALAVNVIVYIVSLISLFAVVTISIIVELR